MGNCSNSQKKRVFDLKKLINSFGLYLRKTRGLAPCTINSYLTNVRIFLQAQSKKNKIDLNHFSSAQLMRSFVTYAQAHSASRTQSLTSSLRSFFRYLKQAGFISDDLASFVPSVANRKKTSFPDFLTSEMTDKLLASFDRKNPSEKRDYAILLLMITLGLRSCEVRNLRLKDFDWDRGEIIICGKGSEERFPMFQDVGKALVDYLVNGREDGKSQKVFIQLKPPFKGIIISRIGKIISSALKRCGLNPKKKGGHLLRHSFAMQLLEKGATLEEIAVVLRHKDIETTAIYAKANFDRLKGIVLPWPQNVKMEGQS